MESLNRYFVKIDGGYQVVWAIRDMVIFAQQNMIKDPPFSQIDILTCRNLLIFLTAKIQEKLMHLFHYSLNPDGFLFLGNAETVGSFTDLFKPLARKSRIYQRLQSKIQSETVEFPTSFDYVQSAVKHPLAMVRNIQLLVDKLFCNIIHRILY
jgi:hypothetical protein